MSEDSSSFELVDSPAMVLPADMTSTPEKPVQPMTSQQLAPEATDTAREPNIEEVKVWGRTEEPGKEGLNSVSGEKPDEPGMEEMETRFRDKLQKKKMEGSSGAKGGWKLRGVWDGSLRREGLMALVLIGLALCLCL